MDNSTSKADLLRGIQTLEEAYDNNNPFLVLASDNANKRGAFLIQGHAYQLIDMLNFAVREIPEFKALFDEWRTTYQPPPKT